MLIVAIYFNKYNVDGKCSASFKANDSDIFEPSLHNVLHFLENNHGIDTSYLDEILVISNDEVIHQYTSFNLAEEEYVVVNDSEIELVD